MTRPSLASERRRECVPSFFQDCHIKEFSTFHVFPDTYPCSGPMSVLLQDRCYVVTSLDMDIPWKTVVLYKNTLFASYFFICPLQESDHTMGPGALLTCLLSLFAILYVSARPLTEIDIDRMRLAGHSEVKHCQSRHVPSVSL